MTEVIVPDYDAIYLPSDPTPEFPAQINRSEWTGTSKVVGLPGAEKWQGVFSFYGLETLEEARKWRAFFAAMRGVENWFRLRFDCQRPATPNPKVGAGATNGYTLPLKGLTAGVVLDAGTYMTVPLPSGHFRAVCLTAPVIADALGNAVAEFTPALNQVPALNTVVEVGQPFIPVRFKKGGAGLQLTGANWGGTFEVEEI